VSLFPLIRFDSIPPDQANDALRRWGHRMGAVERPYDNTPWVHGLFHAEQLVALTYTSTLIREHVGGGLGHLDRSNCLELARLCADRPGLCRVALRLWREFVFPGLGVPVAISYQDADLHSGNTYRFDGWEKVGFSRSGSSDPRTGRQGRDRVIWAWPRGACARLAERRGAA
jgi:antitoxin VapB